MKTILLFTLAIGIAQSISYASQIECAKHGQSVGIWSDLENREINFHGEWSTLTLVPMVMDEYPESDFYQVDHMSEEIFLVTPASASRGELASFEATVLYYDLEKTYDYSCNLSE